MLLTRDDGTMREMILNQLEEIGYEREAIVDALQKKAHNRLSAAYYLLYK
jgi:hypothetical protein